MRYTIDENLLIQIFVEGQEAPLIHQPDNLDGTPWKDAEEATTWAEGWIAEYETALAANTSAEVIVPAP